MSSLCNYSHPELQITDGLIRQDTGRLFPYNPEFYNNATGLYGPAYGYISLMLTIFHFSLGDIGTSFFIALYEAMLPVMLTIIYLFTAFIGLAFLTGIIMLAWSMIERNYKDTVEALKGLGGCIFFGGMLVVPSMLMIHRDRSTTIPDLAIRVSERDQLATLIGGAVTLTFTVVDVFRNSFRERHEEEAPDEEMQILPTAEA
ncbi:hypothetical protein FOC4_g10006883 [Fusarium odoratissimum]|uniref:Uncharacterized protein n=1 Tax=Fusarium oxysporum f. sp. cubense (strain race 4) TaxID=2502994 RepID=N1RIR9_FUSC4|nr:hypothetical protein FOC4_g10006883 [Fusarium odoratissimum]